MAAATSKRKAEAEHSPPSKKRSLANGSSIRTAFRSDLFDNGTVSSYRSDYGSSGPYPHAVVPSLIEDSLLRSVRTEISEHIHFTLKETDIYRIHQSGDLANLSKLDADSLKHLPSLVRLRNALYSPDFREWVSSVTGAGKLSGEKTDMAVNVYTPGSYLLCHDDVIGSRRVSYILYLTDPDKPWRKEWGGGLRLYPTELRLNNDGEPIRVPMADHSLNIPPSFGQLSFFTVLPGESYHDVEEVYHADQSSNNSLDDGGRIRMAISGWFHIPQPGEDGYEAGLEAAQAQKSSLTQLKSAANEFDEPQPLYRHYDEARTVMNSSATATETDPGDESDDDESILTEQDLTFLLQYISPSFLTPDMIEQFSDSFTDTSVLQLSRFFKEPFATALHAHITKIESSTSSPETSPWPVARPPHKHRYAYLQSHESLHADPSPIARILTDLLHAHAFKKWLALVTGLRPHSLVRQDVLARRFRRGKDYALASPYVGETPQLEFAIGITPSEGWERDGDGDGEDGTEANGASELQRGTFPNGDATAENEQGGEASTASSSAAPAPAPASKPSVQVTTSTLPEFGGEEIYMAGEDDDDDTADASNSKALPRVGKKADPAIYRAEDDDGGGGILFSSAPGWNSFSVVLRDRGTLRFVKYVSAAASGDRWDVKGCVELSADAFDEEDDEDGDDGADGPDGGEGQDTGDEGGAGVDDDDGQFEESD
jgi:prolyl 3-hydroxylase /prolyl 3,4-dihydroxylase